jgi:S-DNA-T family DNA segregation ATPase FtsK/SpoIIIE
MVAVVEERVARGYREIVLLCLSCCALFFLIALVTFSSDDPGWSHGTSYKSVHNACGLFGAWLADFVLSFFGLTAYLLPIMLFWAGYAIYKVDNLVYKGWTILLKSSGFIATVLSGSAIFFLHLSFLRTKFKLDLPETPGGILGQEVGDTLVRLLGNSGSTLLVLAVFMTGVTLLTGLSWLEMMNQIGKFAITACALVAQGSSSPRYRKELAATELETKKPRLVDEPVREDKSKQAEEKIKKAKPQIVTSSDPVAPTVMPEAEFKPPRKKRHPTSG